MADEELTVVPEAAAPRPLPFGPGWPEFIGHDPVADRLMPVVRQAFVDYSLVLLNPHGRVVAGGWGVPIRWDGTVADLPDGWDGALDRAVTGYQTNQAPNTFCAMATEVLPEWQRGRVSARVLAALRENAGRRGLPAMIAPTRPTLKARYPLISIEDYATWTRPNGLPFDPWVRVHARLGAAVLAPAPVSMVIEAPVAQWESWAHMAFPQSGRYVVPEALSPLEVDREKDVATYVEPAIWMGHPHWSEP